MSEESNTFILHLRTRWFSAIKTRDKTMEGRLYRNQVQQMKPKDKVIFICEKDQDGVADQIVVRIRSIYVANSFRELYSLFGESLLPKKCLMDEELDDPCVVYDKINDYKQAVENGTKVAGIHVDVIED